MGCYNKYEWESKDKMQRNKSTGDHNVWVIYLEGYDVERSRQDKSMQVCKRYRIKSVLFVPSSNPRVDERDREYK